jgi:hypothetical protein
VFESNASHRHLPFSLALWWGFVATMVFTALTQWIRPEMAQIINIGLTAVVTNVLAGDGLGEKGYVCQIEITAWYRFGITAAKVVDQNASVDAINAAALAQQVQMLANCVPTGDLTRVQIL